MTSDFASQTIGVRLAKVADRLPDTVAIIEQEAQITFGQLDSEATAIASQIVAASKGPASVVCLFFESKLPAIKSIFGAGRSGHAYVSLDAGDPEERLRFILQDSEPMAILTEEALQERAHAIAPADCAIVVVDGPQRHDDFRPLPIVPCAAPLCLHYTSGSTGQPKGTIQTHDNVLFFADAYAKALAVEAGDRLSLLKPLSFAAGNNHIFRGLLHGATLCAYDMRRSGIQQLADWLDRERITLLHAMPIVFREMASRLGPRRLLPHLRAIHLGGESAFASDVELFRKHTLEHCILINQLASTEAGVIAQNVIDHRGPLTKSVVVPVGRCIEGVRVDIRRDDGSIAGPNEVGEMVICSAHVSPGYWRRPALDAAAFSADPLQPGWRRYKSGDLGRMDETGNLHFVGRKDGRVKIRGHSVALMEIEAALSACPDVTKAAVVAIGDGSQMEPARLIAYVVLRQGAARDPLVARRYLATRLPSYMLPAEIVYLDALPLTGSGKVDRKALTQIEPVTSTNRTAEASQDEVERTVARIFEQLLNFEPVGRDDDFFFLGGDSLTGVELQIRLREAFGVHVANLHEDATVARIAATIRRDSAIAATQVRPIPVLMPLWRSGSEPPLFLVHGRHCQAFVSPHFMQLLGDDQPVWVFQARGLDGLREPHSTVEDMAADYLAEMRKQRPHGPYFLGSLCAGVYIATVMARTLQEAGERVLPLLILDPPNRIGEKGYYDRISEERFITEMKMRAARGHDAGLVEDPAYMNALRNTVLTFEHAIAKHRPLPYDGPVYMLSSRDRMQRGSVGLRHIFTGRLKRYEAGETHAEALDPRNPVFASALQRCVGLIREAASAGFRRVTI